MNDKGEVNKAYIVHRTIDNQTSMAFRILCVTFDVDEANKLIRVVQQLSIRMLSIVNLSKLEDLVIEALFTKDD